MPGAGIRCLAIPVPSKRANGLSPKWKSDPPRPGSGCVVAYPSPTPSESGEFRQTGPAGRVLSGLTVIRSELQDSRRRFQMARRFSQSGSAIFALIESRIALEPGGKGSY